MSDQIKKAHQHKSTASDKNANKNPQPIDRNTIRGVYKGITDRESKSNLDRVALVLQAP
jgi:hypothetical protein